MTDAIKNDSNPVKGSCAQCGAVVATSRNWGRSFVEVTRPATDFRPAIPAKLCECCDNPRDPANVIARECAEPELPIDADCDGYAED